MFIRAKALYVVSMARMWDTEIYVGMMNDYVKVSRDEDAKNGDEKERRVNRQKKRREVEGDKKIENAR